EAEDEVDVLTPIDAALGRRQREGIAREEIIGEDRITEEEHHRRVVVELLQDLHAEKHERNLHDAEQHVPRHAIAGENGPEDLPAYIRVEAEPAGADDGIE